MTKVIATEDLRVGWALCFPAGTVLDAEQVETATAKANGWPDKVVAADTVQEAPVGQQERPLGY